MPVQSGIPFRFRLQGLLLTLLAILGLLLAVWLATGLPALLRAGHPPPAVADTGILTQWPLPAGSASPWQPRWDAARNRVWLAEGNHSTSGLDQIAALDPATNLLREWLVPTAYGSPDGVSLDSGGNLWFTESFSNTVGRLQPDSNTITLWALDPATHGHGIAVDDSVANNVKVWFAEREDNNISSLDPATGSYVRHQHPIPDAQPHSVIVAPDHSVWFVETCGARVAQLIPGAANDTWNFWRPPTTPTQCQGGPPVGVGPLYVIFVGTDLWYSDGYNDNLIRLQPASNTFTIWPVPNGGTSGVTTQTDADPDGNIFFSEMIGNKIGRLEPAGASPPIVATVIPTQILTGPTPIRLTAAPIAVVRTPVVTVITPGVETLAGTRTGGIVQWPLPTIPPGNRQVGPARAAYGGGGFWIAELGANKISRFAPYTATPGPGTPSATATQTPSAAPTSTPPAATATPVAPTRTPPPPSATPPAPSATPAAPTGTPSATPCTLSFSDVGPTDYFYTPVLYLACHGVISGYADGTYRPYANTTRAQMVKIVVLGFQKAITTPAGGQYTFADVPPANPFFAVIETAAGGNIVSGYACGGPGEPCDPGNRPYFRPYAFVTRGQLSKITVVAAGWALRNPPTGTFADTLPNTAFYTFVETAVCHSIISGYGCGGPGEPCDAQNRPYFRQYNQATRGQIAKIVYGAITSGAPCAGGQ